MNMTIGEYVREHGDGELAVILMNFMLSLVTVFGVDITKLDMQREYYRILEYVNSPISDELKSLIDMWNTPSDIQS